MSSLQVGIVGLPNAGKSTLFNALQQAQEKMVETSPRPFTTIDPNVGIVPVPDENLEKLCKLVKPENCVPATVKFIDIAGLVKGAHKGEGLGNQFLAKIREVDAIVHIVRAFKNPNVTHQHATHEPGSSKQIIEDIEIVNLELELGDIDKKPTIYVLNANEGDLDDVMIHRTQKEVQKSFAGEVMVVCAKLEEELIDLEEEERKKYLEELGVKKSGLEQLIKKAYELLGLITFYTIKGGKEVRTSSLEKGKTALDAAECIHTDFAKNFIKAEVIPVNQLLEVKGWKQAKEKGLIRVEGKDYVVKDKDVIEFKIGS
jgi:small GTP-binding protein